MRKILLFSLLIISFSGSGQNTIDDSVTSTTATADTAKPLIEIRDREEAQRNIESLLEISKQQSKRRNKEKTMAYVRIGIGVLMLVVLVLGLRRRRKA